VKAFAVKRIKNSTANGMMVKSVDTADLKSAARKGIRVRVPVIPRPTYELISASVASVECRREKSGWKS
jgi:hypothetical protein